MKEWHEYYKEWSVEDYNRHVQAVKGFCHRLAKFTPEHGRMLEVGFGSGQMSIYLAKSGYNLMGIDNNILLVEQASKLSDKIGSQVNFMKTDLFNIPIYNLFSYRHFNTAFSQGLLEHFTDKQIRQAITIQFRIADVIGFSVPLDKFDKQSRGDERLMPKEYWLELVKGYNILFQETFADGKQLMVIFKDEDSLFD